MSHTASHNKKQIVFTVFANASDDGGMTKIFNRMAEFSALWNQHCDYLGVQSEKDAPHFAPCEADLDRPFGRDSIKQMNAIVLDVVGVLDRFGGLRPALARLNCQYFCYVRFDSTWDNPLFRIVVPLDEPIDPELYESCRVPLSLAKKLEVVIDPACLQADQRYAIPCMPEGFLAVPGLDSPFVTISSDDERALSLSDLEEVEDDEIDIYLSRQAPALLVASDDERAPSLSDLGGVKINAVATYLPRQALAAAESASAQHPLFAEMDKCVKQHWGGVEPIFTENACFVFDGIIWKPMSMDTLRHDLLNNFFRRQCSPQKVVQFASAMRQRYYRERFPDPEAFSLQHPSHGQSNYIALTNGTVDPFRRTLVKNDPKHYLRTQLSFAFDPAASCPEFLKYLGGVFAPDQDLTQRIKFVQEMMGYLLIRSTKYQVMFWLYGVGSNGKSILIEIITCLLGAHNVSNVPVTKLGQRFYLAQLVGKLANISDEMGANAVLDDEVLKQTISGGRQQAERKGEQPFEFTPYARIVASTNQLPRTVDKSHGFFRRVRILKFNRVFDTHEQDRGLAEKLRRELPGIFNWALEGLARLEKNGTFTEVPSSIIAQEQYRASVDPVRAFVTECLSIDSTASHGKPPKTLTSAVYRAFVAYCDEHGYPTPNNSYFGRAMSELGLGAKQSNGRSYYPVELRETGEEDE